MLHVGYSKANITPPLGIPIAGYYQLRLAERVLDELEAIALSFSSKGKRALLIVCDLLELKSEYCEPILDDIARRTCIPRQNIFIACTHTHTGPQLDGDAEGELRKAYFSFLMRRLGDACLMAIKDEAPARMGLGRASAPGISFIRRYRMTDGTIHTNPGLDNPEVVCAVGEADDEVSVIRFERENAPDVVLAHFQVHPDTIGGCVISADWPGFARRSLEKALDGVRCAVLNGAIGDLNHVNTHPTGGWMNDLTMDFDDCVRGYGHARHMGRAVAGAVMQIYDKVEWQTHDTVCALQSVIRCPANLPKAEELPKARRIQAAHAAGRDEEIPYTGMQLTTVVAEAERMLLLEHGPEGFDLRISALSIGDAALCGIPGEPFAETGRKLKALPGWKMALPCCCVNGYANYFPLASDYAEGGYEARSSLFQAGVAEQIEAECARLLEKLKKEDTDK